MHRSSANSQGLRLRQIHRLSPPSAPWPTRRRAENLWKRIHSVVDWSSFKTLNTTSSSCLPKKVTTPTLYFQSLTTPNVFGKQSTTPVPQILHTATDHLIVLALHLQTALLLFSHAKYPNYECLSPAILLHHLCIYLSSPATPPRFFSVFTHALDSKIHRILSNCPNRQSHSDHIPTWLLKECSSVLVSTVTNIVNLPHISG